MISLELPKPVAVLEVAGADGSLLKVRRHGRPAAPMRLLLSHGNGFAIDGYVCFWRHFLDDFEVVVFDMRSHGQSLGGAAQHHDYAHMVRDIEAVAAAVRGEWGQKPSAGLFHSMSAQSALLSATRGRPPADALVLFDPPNVPAPGHPAHDVMVRYEHKLAHWATHRRAHFDDPAELAADYARTRTGQRGPDGAALSMAAAVLRPEPAGGWHLACPREGEASMYLQCNTLGLWPQRQHVPVPVTLIAADPDCPYPAPTALSNRALAAEGGFDHRVVPGTTHLLQLEEPAACAAAALAALQKYGLR